MRSATAAPAATDHARDLDRLAAEIAGLEDGAGPRNAEEATRLASCRVNRASLSGDVAELRAAAAAVDAQLARFGPWPDLCYLRASVHLKQHGSPRRRRAWQRAEGLADSPDGRAIQADVDLQLGRYAQARRAYERLAAETRVMGHAGPAGALRSRPGRPRAGPRSSTPTPPTRSPPRSFARSHGSRRSAAGCTCATAGSPRPSATASGPRRPTPATGWSSAGWPRLRAAQGRLDEAIALAEACATRTGRPELAQAAGDLLRRAGAAADARAWHERALAGYLESAGLGEVQYHHHLAEYYADVEGDGDGRGALGRARLRASAALRHRGGAGVGASPRRPARRGARRRHGGRSRRASATRTFSAGPARSEGSPMASSAAATLEARLGACRTRWNGGRECAGSV